MKRKNILIVEDEAMIAMTLEDMVADLGFGVVGPVGSVKSALAVLAGGAEIDCALLDVNLRGETVYPVADALMERKIPFAFSSGYGETGIDPRFAENPVLPKPLDSNRLISFLMRAVTPRPDGSP